MELLPPTPGTSVRDPRSARIALVLGGGGLKGFAHLGVLRALEEIGVTPVLYAGSSIGALVSAARALGKGVEELVEHAVRLRRRDLFRINHFGMLLERMRAPSIYLEQPLRDMIGTVVPHVRFDERDVPVFVNTVDVERGTQVIWGLPGHRDVYIDDAVYASCALPGFFPPGRVDGRVCIDGGTLDNLPVSVVGDRVDAIIAVDVGSSDLPHLENVADEGFASIYMRAATVMMHELQGAALARWAGAPMILVRPRVAHFGWFAFDHTAEMIELGYRAARDVLADLPACLASSGGVFPRRVVRLSVDASRCNGCGLCAAQAPRVMALDASGRAFPITDTVDWSPADGEFVRHCPTGAIDVRRVVPVLEAAD
jgi:NTE family protein